MRPIPALAVLLCATISSLQACKSPEPPFPHLIDENEYLFLVVPKDADLTDELLAPASARAEAFCRRSGKKHIVDVEPKVVTQNQHEMSAYHFSCCKPDPAFVEPRTVEEVEQFLNAPYVWCE